eukprot:gnl/TRDRNA2_/TRDRNA2_85565_c0_seq2.p1 gnl/TRDRNA2_/TRDRNA2_85565_c0~~gnl/TRDRNA2_/TRDRNA2_85565_c0_seq2.p1  ORF type:complete len:511 (+),score=61.53 gnl/TRDRNA2_/TRDRNA2_85565_c0_seq2:83-1615(+)
MASHSGLRSSPRSNVLGCGDDRGSTATPRPRGSSWKPSEPLPVPVTGAASESTGTPMSTPGSNRAGPRSASPATYRSAWAVAGLKVSQPRTRGGLNAPCLANRSSSTERQGSQHGRSETVNSLNSSCASVKTPGGGAGSMGEAVSRPVRRSPWSSTAPVDRRAVLPARGRVAAESRSKTPDRPLGASRSPAGRMGSRGSTPTPDVTARRTASRSRACSPDKFDASIFPATGSCREVLQLVGSLRDALSGVLGVQESSVWGGNAGGPPPRKPPGVGGGSQQQRPSAREICRLRDVSEKMCRALSGLQVELDGLNLPVSDEGGVNRQRQPQAQAQQHPQQQKEHASVEEYWRLHSEVAKLEGPANLVGELDNMCRQLRTRAEELEAPAARAADLEKVVEQLRVRVAELEARGSRISALREQCAILRERIAELVVSAVDPEGIEEQCLDLRARVAELEMRAVVTPRAPSMMQATELPVPPPPTPLREAQVSSRGQHMSVTHAAGRDDVVAAID